MGRRRPTAPLPPLFARPVRKGCPWLSTAMARGWLTGKDGVEGMPEGLADHAAMRCKHLSDDRTCQSSAATIASRWRSQRVVLPSISVKGNVTVPVGSSRMGTILVVCCDVLEEL